MILANKRLGVIGPGNMAEALVRGMLDGGHIAASSVELAGPNLQRLADLAARYGVTTTTNNATCAKSADILLLAVKPQMMRRVLQEIAADVGPHTLVISIAAGIDTDQMQHHLHAGARVIRAMPNTPALVAAGATAVSRGQHATAEDMAVAMTIFNAVGIAIELDESQLDAVTGLSGSGPAYIFLILEALADAGVKVGLSRKHAQLLAAQTVMGSAKLLLDTDEHPGKLKDMVTSPGGTAIAGLHTLEQGGLRTTLINAVETATKRAKELGQGIK
jgi:pyrroline-5-carboxylate reductase